MSSGSASVPPSSKQKYRALLSSASKTAGCDNWKTSTGRIDGPDNFVAGDVWRLMKIHCKSTSKPQVCPVCMDNPPNYVTKSCKHAVCRECLQDYAASLINDPNHSGPLKCPCCPRLLRVEDAKVALDTRPGGNGSQHSSMSAKPKAVLNKVKSIRGERGGLFDEPENDPHLAGSSALEVLERWDNKKRDEMLRSMRDFRPCPHCGNREESSNIGGGFVTPECLAPINEERESKAERFIRMAGNPSSQAVLLLYVMYYLYCTGGSAESKEMVSTARQLILALIPALFLPILPHVIRYILATMARTEIMRPIVVTCPCCHEDFNLAACSELNHAGSSSDTAAEAATERWKNSNTRPCPGCGSPIMKDGGCNHVKCGSCRVDFCWGCMRSRTSCRAYQCRHGAPYGNAFGDGSTQAVRAGLVAERERLASQTLIERIDQVEAVAIRNLGLLRSFPLRRAAMSGCVVACICVMCSRIYITGLLCFGALIPYCIHQLRIYNGQPNHRENNRQDADMRMRQNNNNIRRVPGRRRRHSMSFRQPRFRNEEEQFAEAIARSLVDQ